MDPSEVLLMEYKITGYNSTFITELKCQHTKLTWNRKGMIEKLKVR